MSFIRFTRGSISINISALYVMRVGFLPPYKYKIFSLCKVVFSLLKLHKVSFMVYKSMLIDTKVRV